MSKTSLQRAIIKDIMSTITVLRTEGLLRDENGISESKSGNDLTCLTYSGKNDSCKIIYDKHISSTDLIAELLKNQQYTILFYDKSLVQAEFILNKDGVVKERLVFMKKHNKLWNAAEIQEDEAEDIDWFEEEEGIPTILRIDFAPDDQIDLSHPASHLTLSNHECCRIPIKSAVTFSEFIRFILFHFYNKELPLARFQFNMDDTITSREKKSIHINWE